MFYLDQIFTFSMTIDSQPDLLFEPVRKKNRPMAKKEWVTWLRKNLSKYLIYNFASSTRSELRSSINKKWNEFLFESPLAQLSISSHEQNWPKATFWRLNWRQKKFWCPSVCSKNILLDNELKWSRLFSHLFARMNEFVSQSRIKWVFGSRLRWV